MKSPTAWPLRRGRKGKPDVSCRHGRNNRASLENVGEIGGRVDIGRRLGRNALLGEEFHMEGIGESIGEASRADCLLALVAGDPGNVPDCVSLREGKCLEFCLDILIDEVLRHLNVYLQRCLARLFICSSSFLLRLEIKAQCAASCRGVSFQTASWAPPQHSMRAETASA